VYYPVLDATVGRPYAVHIYGNNDTTGAVGEGRENHYWSEVETPARPGDRHRHAGRRRPRGRLGARRTIIAASLMAA
jgi:hypothetical protein